MFVVDHDAANAFAKATLDRDDGLVVEYVFIGLLPKDVSDPRLHRVAVRARKALELIAASARGDNAIVARLLHDGAELNFVPHQDTLMPALITATDCDHHSTARYLLSHGANPNVIGSAYTNDGASTNHTAYNHAKHLRKSRFMSLLLTNGADPSIEVVTIHEPGPK